VVSEKMMKGKVYNGRQTPSDDKSSRELKILQKIWIAYLLIQETKTKLSFLKIVVPVRNVDIRQ
jgi:hypothetical protein